RSFMRSTASKLIEASSRIAVCGHPPVSTPAMRSADSALLRTRNSMSSLVKMSFVMTANSYRPRITLQRRSSKAVLPEPTGPPTPILTGRLMFSRSEKSAVHVSMIHLLNIQNRRETSKRFAFVLKYTFNGAGKLIYGLRQHRLPVLLSYRDQTKRGRNHS